MINQSRPLIAREDLKALVSPGRDKDKARYNWYMYKHSYSNELVDLLLDEFQIKNGAVLDPFCGGGTTLLACKERGINSFGYDILPFSVFVTQVKTSFFDLNQLKEDFKTFNPSNEEGKLPDVDIVNKAFSSSIKRTIVGLRNWINTLSSEKNKQFFLLALLSTLDKSSKAVKSGGFLRLVKKRTTRKEMLKNYYNAVQKMFRDVEILPLDSPTIALAEVGDARLLPNGQLFDAMITSPPYPNRHDYTRVYALELLASFINSNDELKQLRYKTLRSHVEARRKFKAQNYKVPRKLEIITEKLKNKELNNSQIVEMLLGYFEDMYISLCEMKKNLKQNGKIALVVSNVRYAGILIPVDKILAELGELAGLKIEKILVVRKRGNSAQQMKRYKRKPNRESIVIWINA